MKILDVIRKDEMQDKGHCYNCTLAWEQGYPDDYDCGCIVNWDNDMEGKKECLYPNWLKRIVLKRHNEKEEQYWEEASKRIYEEE